MKIFNNKYAWLSLGLITISIILNIYWVWGIVLLIWIFHDLKNGATWLSETVYKSENPILYYLIIIFWLGLAIYFISELYYYVTYYLGGYYYV